MFVIPFSSVDSIRSEDLLYSNICKPKFAHGWQPLTVSCRCFMLFIQPFSSEIWRPSARDWNRNWRVASRWRRISEEYHSRRSRPFSAVWLRLPVRPLVVFRGVVRVRAWACSVSWEKRTKVCGEGTYREDQLGEREPWYATSKSVMRRNVKIALLLSCAWMFAFVYYYHTSKDSKVRNIIHCQLTVVFWYQNNLVTYQIMPLI